MDNVKMNQSAAGSVVFTTCMIMQLLFKEITHAVNTTMILTQALVTMQH